MDRYAAGDGPAFSEVYDMLAPRLLVYLRRQVREESRARDLVQDTFMQIHRGRASFMAGSAVLPWAFSIARRLLIDDIRRGKRNVQVVDPDDPRASHVRSDARTDGMLEARELAGRMQRALERLPPLQREAFELVKQDGFTLLEAAEALGTTVTAVKLRTHRAYEALRGALGDDFDPGKGTGLQ